MDLTFSLYNNFTNTFATVCKPLSYLAYIPEAVFSWRFVFQKDEKVWTKDTRTDIENKVNQLAYAAGIRKRVEVIERKNMISPAQAMGGENIPGRAGIAFDSDGRQEFVIAHEIVHIKHNDRLTVMAPSIVSMVIATMAEIGTIFCLPALVVPTLVLVSFTVTLVAMTLLSRRVEKRADLEGVALCSEEGKTGAVDFFRNLQNESLYLKNQIEKNLPDWSSQPVLRLRCWAIDLCISQEGNDLLDIFHPSLTSRISYLEKE
jgi:hypothetical protein